MIKFRNFEFISGIKDPEFTFRGEKYIKLTNLKIGGILFFAFTLG